MPVHFLRNAAVRSHLKAAQQEWQRSDTSCRNEEEVQAARI
jgi:hypothetical protein